MKNSRLGNVKDEHYGRMRLHTLSTNSKSHEMKAPEAQVETPLISNDNSMIEMMVSHSSG